MNCKIIVRTNSVILSKETKQSVDDMNKILSMLLEDDIVEKILFIFDNKIFHYYDGEKLIDVVKDKNELYWELFEIIEDSKINDKTIVFDWLNIAFMFRELTGFKSFPNIKKLFNLTYLGRHKYKLDVNGVKNPISLQFKIMFGDGGDDRYYEVDRKNTDLGNYLPYEQKHQYKDIFDFVYFILMMLK